MVMLCIFGMLGEGGMELGSLVAEVRMVRTLGELEGARGEFRARNRGESRARRGESRALIGDSGPLIGDSRARLATGDSGIFLLSPFRLPT